MDAAFRASLRPVPGVVDALNGITEETCVASSGPHSKMQLTLGLCGLLGRFEGRIFSAWDVPNGKPSPDLFLHAASSLGFSPGECVVVEDSPVGVAAARAAGMRCFGFAARTPAERLAEADHVFNSMAELPGLINGRH
jgi:HAD superfamily hydrolase (TIGR01509 family)